uniref:preprotein translocase subunit SecA n=1 Tax=Duncaniella muris TaxID=2094150 RepID=UPI00272B4361
FDYLRDNMASDPSELVQREDHYYAIVDEVDSVLIDDARTPLIISGPVPKGDDQMFNEFKPNVQKVVEAQRKLANSMLVEAKAKIAAAWSGDEAEVAKYDKGQAGEGKKFTAKMLEEEGGLALFRVYKALPKYGPLIRYLSQDGVKQLMLRIEGHYMQDNNREMPKAVEPLFFVIDEKNHSIELTDKGIEVLTGTTDDPLFFVLPDIAAQLSQVENEPLSTEEKVQKKDDLLNSYAEKAERVHTVNQLLKAYTLFDLNVEYVIDDGKIKIVDEQTGRIMEGRRYSDGLHQAIEAKEHVKVEAATQTFATITLQNYFRMYHKLAGMTGTAETEAGEFWDIYKLDVVTIPTNKPIARIDMNDRVYKTKKEKYAAVIEEIQDLVSKGRPVLVGTTSVEISELLSRMLTMRHIPHNVLNAKLHQKEAEIVAHAGKKGMVTIATNMAGRGTDIKLTPEVKAAGGLAIIGTERHESRRVDRQLRGRSGRQGDPGSSVFYVSFEDQLMRLFATDRVMKMLDTLGLEEGERIESGMVTNAIGNAQKRVEENNFGIRKRLLEYDDVMNKQRTYIYNRRHHALLGERIGIDIANMMWDIIENLVNNYSPAEYEDLSMELLRVLTIEAPFTEEEYRNMSKEDAIEKIHTAAQEAFDRKGQRILDVAQPVITDCVENRGFKGRIAVPMTDGKRFFNLVVDIDEAYRTGCKSIVKEWHKAVLLVSIDELWKEHLRELDQLRQSVQNASYEQKDPLVIYKVESFHLFEAMLNNLNVKAMATLMRGQIYVQQPAPRQEAPAENAEGEAAAAEDEGAEAPRQQTEAPRPQPKVERAMPERANDYSKYRASRENLPGEAAQRAAAQGAGQQRVAPQPVKAGPRINRNDPCPCGSGKKYKNCHGKGL